MSIPTWSIIFIVAWYHRVSPSWIIIASLGHHHLVSPSWSYIAALLPHHHQRSSSSSVIVIVANQHHHLSSSLTVIIGNGHRHRGSSLVIAARPRARIVSSARPVGTCCSSTSSTTGCVDRHVLSAICYGNLARGRYRCFSKPFTI